MVSVVIILFLWLTRKFLFGSDLFVEMLDYVFVRNDKQELNIYLSNKQTRLNIDQTLSSLVILGLKNLIFRIQFQFIKNECNKKKIFKLFSIRLLVFIKLLLAAYIMFVYALKPSTPDLDIKEINGSYYYFRTDCVTEDVSRTGRIIKDCEEYALGSPLSDQQIKQHYEKIDFENNYFDKFYFFLRPPFDFGGVINGIYFLIICFLIFSFCSAEKKSFLFFDNQYIFNKFLISKKGKLSTDADQKSFTHKRKGWFSDKELEFKVLMIKYLYNKLNQEENYYFESLLKLGFGTWKFRDDGVDDKYDYTYYMNRYFQSINKKVVKSKTVKRLENLFVADILFLLSFPVLYSFAKNGNPFIWGLGTMYFLIVLYKKDLF